MIENLVLLFLAVFLLKAKRRPRLLVVGNPNSLRLFPQGGKTRIGPGK
jgi:hypothetical protein